MARFCLGAAILAAMLLIAAWHRGWFSGEPTYRGRTVTKWLDKLALYEPPKKIGNTTYTRLLRPPEEIARSPAYQALLKIGSNGLPVLIQTLRRPAEWSPDVSAFERGKMWVQWRCHQLVGDTVSRPTPSEWSRAQTLRKTAAGFMLVGLGTNSGGGFTKYLEVYASAPKNQSIYGTTVTGDPVGVNPFDVFHMVISVRPEQRQEIVEEVLKALDHTNAQCRAMALKCTSFREELLRRRKDRLVQLTRDEDPEVRQAAIISLHAIVLDKALVTLMSPAEIAEISQTVLSDSRNSPQTRWIARTVFKLATNQEPVKVGPP